MSNPISREDRWLAQLERYKKYCEDKDSLSSKEKYALWSWMNNQKRTHKLGKLSKNRMEKLNAIGFFEHDIQWDASFKEFKAYLDGNPFDNELLHANKQLRRWYQSQRMAHNKQKLKKERLEQFNINDIPLNLKQARFKNRLNQLAAYHSENGHFLVSCEDNEKWPGLHNWVERIRRQFNYGKLSEDEISWLYQIEFEWVSYTALKKWESMFEKLKAFLDTDKDIYSAEGTELRNWVRSQKTHYKNGKLLPSLVKKLKSLGFQFEMDIAPNANIAKARDFFVKHGHYDFKSVGSDSDHALTRWTYYIQAQIEKKMLPEEKITQLKEMGIFSK